MSGVLGQTVAAPKHYSPDILEAIPRAAGRRELGLDDLPPLLGADVWHLYELSWLDKQERPRHYVGVLSIPSGSANTVESKSLKLYLNSLNFTAFESPQAAEACITRDVAGVAGEPVSLVLLDPTGLGEITREPEGELIDSALTGNGAPDADGRHTLLQPLQNTVETRLVSHSLRSLCPVTGQPDWGSLAIDYKGAGVEPGSLLAYIESYREHQEFHEQCVERIFADLWRALRPEVLTVAAFYQRRGGIDITPWRASAERVIPLDRMGRQ